MSFNLQSAICGLQSAVCSLQSVVCKCHTPIANELAENRETILLKNGKIFL